MATQLAHCEGPVLPSGQVTFLFTDIEGSTRLVQMLGQGYREVLHEHRRLLRCALLRRGGVELFTEGDSYFFVFGDAVDAVRACVAAQRALAEHAWADPRAVPKVRMGLHTAMAQPQAGEYTGAEVHRAARVAAAAHGGQVLVSGATAQAAGATPDGRLAGWEERLLDLGMHRLRGFDDRERLFQLLAPGLERDFPRPRTQSDVMHNLPEPLTSFVGRGPELATLSTLIDRHRLVTVVGAGGAGKSRLALAACTQAYKSYRDGVWWLDLATVSDPELVGCALATVLGLRPEPGRPITETLVEHLTGKQTLLLLDTCEAQLAATVDVVAALLSGVGSVRVMATSREPLGIAGELVWRIPPLSMLGRPDGRPSDAVVLLEERTRQARGGRPSDAVVLLEERTRQARGGRPVSVEERRDLEQVVSRLDGLPLAIELAAARLRVLTAGELAARLRSELTSAPVDPLEALDAGRDAHVGAGMLPAGLRHTTMQATVTWSYRTLPDSAARLLRWLSVFAGPVRLATVEWLLDADPLEPLTTLVDKSLLQAEPGPAGTTYRMLDPIRGYAGKRLAEAGEEHAMRDRHVAWAQHCLDGVGQGSDGQPVTLSLYDIDALADELRAALRWCSWGGSAVAGLWLSNRLDQWWRERGLAREGRLWLFRLYARLREAGESISDVELAYAYHAHTGHAAADGEYAEMLRFSHRAELVARRAGSPGLLARVRAGRTGALMDAGQPNAAEQECRQVLAWATANGVAADALIAVFNLAELLWLRGAYDEAADLLAGSRQWEQQRPTLRGRRTVDLLLGLVALGRGDLVAAHDHLTVALRARMDYGFHSRACVAIRAIAARCVAGSDWSTGAVLFGAAERLTARLHKSPGMVGPYWKAQQEAARKALGDTAFDEAYARGAELTLAEAAQLALNVKHPDLVVTRSDLARLLS